MAQYTVLLENEIQEVADRYKLQVVSYQPIEQGSANSNYYVKTNRGEYIFTILEIDPSRISNMVELLSLLEKHQYPAPRIRYTADGDLLTIVHGKPLLVKSYITGQVVKDLDEHRLKQVGAALARLHEVPVPEFLPHDHPYILIIYPKVIKQSIDPKYVAWLERSYRFLVADIPSGLPCGLNHGDLFYDNVLFEGRKFKALIDFEESCQTYKIFDLGMAALGLCTGNSTVLLPKVRALINGYQDIILLADEEKSSLQLFIELAAVLTSAWRFWKFNIDSPDTPKVDTHLQMVEISNQIRAQSKDKFLNTIFFA